MPAFWFGLILIQTLAVWPEADLRPRPSRRCSSSACTRPMPTGVPRLHPSPRASRSCPHDRLRRHVESLRPRGDARRPVERLRAHRPGQGRSAPPGDLASRRAQLARARSSPSSPSTPRSSSAGSSSPSRSSPFRAWAGCSSQSLVAGDVFVLLPWMIVVADRRRALQPRRRHRLRVARSESEAAMSGRGNRRQRGAAGRTERAEGVDAAADLAGSLHHRIALVSIVVLAILMVVCFGAAWIAPFPQGAAGPPHRADEPVAPSPARHRRARPRLPQRDPATPARSRSSIGLAVAVLSTVVGTALGADRRLRRWLGRRGHHAHHRPVPHRACRRAAGCDPAGPRAVAGHDRARPRRRSAGRSSPASCAPRCCRCARRSSSRRRA